MLVTVENVTFGYGDNLILDNVNFSVNEGERIGLIGANGEGKTTLIRLIVGGILPDSGKIIRKNGAKTGYLEQSGGYESGNTVYEEMLAVFKEDLAAIAKISALSEKLANAEYGSAEYKAAASAMESVQSYIASRDCYNTEVKIKTVLNGMGFSGKYNQIVDTMSGGEKTRLKLARLLLEQPDLLILDEPTNHLDVSTLFWLEDYLSTFKGAILTVSHDRYFLDKICKRILETENKKILSFTGNYTKYKILKAEHNARQLKEYEAQQEERARLQDYVDRNIVRATTAKSALSRVNKLERMEILDKPYVPPKAPQFDFGFETASYENVLKIKDLNLEIGGKTLIYGGELEIRRGERVAVVGENGTGKTTLLKCILSGNNKNTELGRFVKLAYYDQEGENLNGSNTVLSELWERHTGLTQTEVRAALARAGLYEEDMHKSVASLSGGERAKLALCVLECERGNVLLLDEPTNHLDLPARESLENALKKFEGTLIFVSHDRYFLSALAGKVAEIEDKKLNIYQGGYGFYTEQKAKRSEEKLLKEREAEQLKRQQTENSAYRSKKERAEEARKKELIKRIEADICFNEAEELRLSEQLSNPEVASDYVKVREITEQLRLIKNNLDALYKEYENVL